MAQRHQRRHDERRRRRRGRGGAASTTWWLLASAVAVAAVLSCASAQRAGVREAPTVTVHRQGAVSGVEVPLNKIGHRAWMYLGIPFAQPPLGDLRFAPPAVEPPPSWTGVRNGSAHMPSCLQDPPARPSPVYRLFATVAPPLRTSEDCLYLNVYRPEGAVPDEKFPVMVWFHPGDFHWGSPAFWDASVLAARHKVIVVTTAYRLNIMGFFTDNTVKASGNWGLLDQAAALDWVARNIDSFGGSAQNVTAFGQGAGAVSVGLHVVSPWSRDKLQRAIGMSGNALQRAAMMSGPSDELSSALDVLTKKFDCYLNTLAFCLRNKNADDLVKGFGSLIHWGPVVDGPVLSSNGSGGDEGAISHEPFLPDWPAALMEDNQFATVPYMIGYNRMENAFDAFERLQDGGSGFTRDQFESLIGDAVDSDAADGGGGSGLNGVGNEAANCTLNADFAVDTVMMRYAKRTDDTDTLRRTYVTMAANKEYGATAYRVAALASQFNTTYVYRYEYKLRAAKALPTAAEWMDAPHGAELPLVWGMPYWPSAAAAAIDWTAADRRMADVAMLLWTNFAKYADPTHRLSNVRWDEFQPRMPRPMVLDKFPNMSAAPDQEAEFWNEYYPKVLTVSLQCCNNFTADSAAVATVPSSLFLFVAAALMAAPSVTVFPRLA